MDIRLISREGVVMSKSYRRNKILKDHNPYMKKIFNRRLRRTNIMPLEMPDGNKYKVLNESWDINEFSLGYKNWQSFKENNLEFFNSEKECYVFWKKHYVCK